MKTSDQATRHGQAALLGATLALGLSVASAEAATFNAPDDVTALTKMENDLQGAYNMESIINDYAPNAVVLDMYAPGLYRGRPQIQAAFDKQFTVLKSLKYQIHDLNIASDGTFACAAMRNHFDSILKDGTKISISLREIDAFKKIGGRWQVIQSHISMPADPKTGMAVTDGAMPDLGPIAWSSDPIPAATESPEAAKKQIRHWMDVGVLSTNIDQLMSYYGPGNDFLVYDTFYPGEIRGKAELRAYYTPIMSSYNSVKVKMPLFVADSDGAFGVQLDQQQMQLAMKDGSTKYIALRQSDCMRRVDGKWYSFFEMVSFPVDMKTNKSVMEDKAAFK